VVATACCVPLWREGAWCVVTPQYLVARERNPDYLSVVQVSDPSTSGIALNLPTQAGKQGSGGRDTPPVMVNHTRGRK
jgi:hypothetical protein